MPPSKLESVESEGDSDMKGSVKLDAGLTCCIQVVGSFCIWTNTWGLCNAFGEFQAYYETILPQSPSQIAWIGSLQSFFLLFSGIASGYLCDAGYFRSLMVGGNLFIVLGMMLTSICTEYWQIIICQGVVTGLGFGLIFTPGVSILPQYFEKRRQLANGIAAVGSGFGGVIYPIILHRLAPSIGFPWAVRLVAFVSLFFSITAVATLRNRRAHLRVRRPIPPGFFSDRAILLYSAGLFFICIAIYTPVVYISTYSLHYHITDQNLAFYLVPILQASNIIGRLIPNYFADKTGPVNMTIPATLCAGIMVFAWVAIRSQGGLLAFAVLYGVFFGTILALGPGCVASLSQRDMDALGGRMGTSFALASFGVLIGTPVAGVMLGDGDHFVTLQTFTGGICILSTVFYAACRWSKGGTVWAKI